MTSRTELFDIGRIVRPHGVRGEVKVEPSTQFPDRFLEMESVIVRPPNREPRRYQIAQARHQNNFVLLKLVDIDSMEAAEALREVTFWSRGKSWYPYPRDTIIFST